MNSIIALLFGILVGIVVGTTGAGTTGVGATTGAGAAAGTTAGAGTMVGAILTHIMAMEDVAVA